jgi:hypothetical protein
LSRQDVDDSAERGCQWCAFILRDSYVQAQATSQRIQITIEIWIREFMVGLQSLKLTLRAGGESSAERLGYFFYAEHGKDLV